MKQRVFTSKRGTVNLYDIGQGLLVAGGLSVLNVIYETVQAGSFSFDWKHIASSFVSGCVAYILIQLPKPQRVVIKPAADSTIEGIDKVNGK